MKKKDFKTLTVKSIGTIITNDYMSGVTGVITKVETEKDLGRFGKGKVFYFEPIDNQWFGCIKITDNKDYNLHYHYSEIDFIIR